MDDVSEIDHDADIRNVPQRPPAAPERRHTVAGCPGCDGQGHRPSHDPSPMCESGRRAHCSCDTCF